MVEGRRQARRLSLAMVPWLTVPSGQLAAAWPSPGDGLGVGAGAGAGVGAGAAGTPGETTSSAPLPQAERAIAAPRVINRVFALVRTDMWRSLRVVGRVVRGEGMALAGQAAAGRHAVTRAMRLPLEWMCPSGGMAPPAPMVAALCFSAVSVALRAERRKLSARRRIS